MKIVKAVFLALLLAVTFTACKKDNEEPFIIEGLWEGKIGTGSASPSGQYALNIQKGGVIERISSNGQASAVGTWQLTGKNFSATYNFLSGTTVVNVTGTIDKSSYRLTGNWSNSGDEEGTFYVAKKN